jgi:hypothetical protein
MVGTWEAEGRCEVTERWCSVMPPLSAEPTSDLIDTANSYHRVQEILKRYRGELQGLVPMGAGTGITS